MTHELLLLRHAKSDWSVECDDFSRPLKKRGRHAAKEVGRWLRKQNLMPDMILSSPAQRALATAQRVCRQLNIDESTIITDPRIYEAHSSTLLEILSATPKDIRRLLLIGHNPGLEDLLSKLIQHSIPLSESGKGLTTAALAQLTFEGGWTALTEGIAELTTLFRPDSVPGK
jgi:phosphohistidine phosphatase